MSEAFYEKICRPMLDDIRVTLKEQDKRMDMFEEKFISTVAGMSSEVSEMRKDFRALSENLTVMHTQFSGWQDVITKLKGAKWAIFGMVALLLSFLDAYDSIIKFIVKLATGK